MDKNLQLKGETAFFRFRLQETRTWTWTEPWQHHELTVQLLASAARPRFYTQQLSFLLINFITFLQQTCLFQCINSSGTIHECKYRNDATDVISQQQTFHHVPNFPSVHDR